MFSTLSQGDANAIPPPIFSMLVPRYIETLIHSSFPLRSQPIYSILLKLKSVSEQWG